MCDELFCGESLFLKAGEIIGDIFKVEIIGWHICVFGCTGADIGKSQYFVNHLGNGSFQGSFIAFVCYNRIGYVPCSIPTFARKNFYYFLMLRICRIKSNGKSFWSFLLFIKSPSAFLFFSEEKVITDSIGIDVLYDIRFDYSI